MHRSLRNDDLRGASLSSEHTGYHIQRGYEYDHNANDMLHESERSKLQRAVHKAERCLFFAIQEQTHFRESSHSKMKNAEPNAHLAVNAWNCNHDQPMNFSYHDYSQCIDEGSDEELVDPRSSRHSDELADDMRDTPEHASMIMACEQVSNAILQHSTFPCTNSFQCMNQESDNRVCGETFTDTCNLSQDFGPMNWSSPTDEEAMLVEEILQYSRAAQM